MLVVIGNKSIRIFLKALKFLAKYSPEYIFEVSDGKFHIKTCSTTQVSLAVATFDELFFVRYEESNSTEENICRVSAKILLTVLKNAKTLASLTLKINIAEDCLYVNLHKYNDYVVKNKIALLEFDQLDDYTMPKDISEATLQPSVLRRVLQSSKGIDELEFDFKFDSVTIKSFIDHPEEDCEAIRLNYTVDASEFNSFKLKSEKTLVVSCDDFVILLDLAQSLDMEILMQFSVPGRPMISVLKIDGSYTLSLVQATLPPKSIKRNIRNQSYKQVVESYMGNRQGPADEDVIQEDPKNNTGQINASNNPKIIKSRETGRDAGIAANSNSDKSKENVADKSVSQAYMSTPSKIVRGKRKSTDESRIEVDLDATKDDVIQKRQRTLNSTVVGANLSIALSQNEINEVNDIMADIYHIQSDDIEINEHIELPQTQKSNSEQDNDENRPQNQVHESKSNENTENTDKMNTDEPFSHERWPIHNSYFGGDSENIEKQAKNQDNKNKPRQKGQLESIFNHLFKPRSKVQFGKILVPGSDSESEDIA